MSARVWCDYCRMYAPPHEHAGIEKAGSGSPPEPSPAPFDAKCPHGRPVSILGIPCEQCVKAGPSSSGAATTSELLIDGKLVALRNAIGAVRCDGAYPAERAVEPVEALVSRLSKERDAYRRNATAYLYDAKVAVREREALRAERDGLIAGVENAVQYARTSVHEVAMIEGRGREATRLMETVSMLRKVLALSGVPADKGEQ